jgi:hypothetical protein
MARRRFRGIEQICFVNLSFSFILTLMIIAKMKMKENIMANKKNRDPIPKHFKSIEDAAEFWDNHDLGDYWDLTREAHFEVDIKRRVFLTALEPQLAKKLTGAARQQGVSTETLINVWLTEKLAQA